MSFYTSFDSIKKVGLLFFLLFQSAAICAVSSESIATNPEITDDSIQQDQQQKFNFPQWPVRKPIEREQVPPPPPGPYMSLGLNDFPVRENTFDSNMNPSQIEVDPSGVPLQTFSPDVPWPANIRQTKRWMPENGYQYVKPPVEKKPNPDVRNYPAYNYGYQRNPAMDWPRSGPNWAPSMGAGPYRYTPDYNPGYSSPANNNRYQQGNSAYRAPYPVPGKP
jgi:hypothetical protein